MTVLRIRPDRPWRVGLAAAFLCVGVSFASLAGAAVGPSASETAQARALRTLTANGFTGAAAVCTARMGHSTTCRWTGVRRTACSGTLKVSQRSRRGRFVTITRTACRGIAFGFNAFVSAANVALQRTTGAKVIRMLAPWYTAEPYPGGWSWTEIDRQYRLAIDGGLRPLLVAIGSPCWARGSAACVPAVTGPPDHAHDAQWREYTRRLAERYPEAAGIEIWNEPNLSVTFTPKADPERFAQLLALAHDGIKQAAPSMPVISGGVLAAGLDGENAAGFGDVTFLRRMLAAGAARSVDAIGVHPYPSHPRADGSVGPWNPLVAGTTLDALRGVAVASGAGGTPFWITETGESTASQNGQPAAVAPARQASDLVQILRTLSTRSDVDGIVIHTLIDAPPNPVLTGVDNVIQPVVGAVFFAGVNSGFGIFDAAERPKPAACAVSRELGGTLTC
ncbi:MAG: hypothetical protein JWM31_2507 [Solirubrobacterales bacterium]|nr:hypothetical protein [Solirubrobacterales bacterium]